MFVNDLFNKKKITESLRAGEYYTFKVFFDDGTVETLNFASDDVDWDRVGSKRNKQVIDAKRQGGIRGEPSDAPTKSHDFPDDSMARAQRAYDRQVPEGRGFRGVGGARSREDDEGYSRTDNSQAKEYNQARLERAAKERKDLLAALAAASKKQKGIKEAVPYALSAANANAEHARTADLQPYQGRIRIPGVSADEYRNIMSTLLRAAKQSGQHVETGLSDGNMHVFSDSMSAKELKQFVSDALGGPEQGVAEAKHFKTAYGWAGGNKPGGGTYKHPNQIKADKEAKKAKKEKQNKEQGVAEGSNDWSGPLYDPALQGNGKKQRYEMMFKNGQVKRFSAMNDNEARKIAAGHGAKSVIRMKGNVPSDKIKEQGVAEGISVVDQDYDLDQIILTLDIEGKKVSFTYWNYDENFANAERKDVFDQLQKQPWYARLDHPTQMEILDAAYRAIRGLEPQEYRPTVGDEPLDEQGVAEGSETHKYQVVVKGHKRSYSVWVEAKNEDVAIIRAQQYVAREHSDKAKHAAVVDMKQGVAEGLKFHGGFPDVDHMPGAVYKNGDRPKGMEQSQTSKRFFSDKSAWDRAVNEFNSSVFDDNSEFTSSNGIQEVEANGHVWAKWSDNRNKGFIDMGTMSESVGGSQTDYQKRRQRERDVDAGKPVKPQPRNPQNDYFARRKKEKDLAEGHDDTVAFELDSENAYNHVTDKFGSVIDWDGDIMVAPRKYWGAIQELAYAAGGEATEAGNEQDVDEAKHFRTSYGWSGGRNEKTGRTYKHPDQIKADKAAKKSGISKDAETQFHSKLDSLVHDTFGKRKSEMEEGSTQDRLHRRHQELRKKSGLPDPDYYRELKATYDLPDDERYAKAAELKKKYKVKESVVTNEDIERYVEELERAGYEMVNEKQNRSPGKVTKSEDPCWSGYHMVGKKKKNGRTVPNCVPGKKG